MVTTNRNGSFKEEATLMMSGSRDDVVAMDSMIPMMDFENDDAGMLFDGMDDLDFQDITMDPAAIIPDPKFQESLQLPPAQQQDKVTKDIVHPAPAIGFNTSDMMNLETSPIKKKPKRKRKITNKAAKANEEDLFAPTEKIKPKPRRKKKPMALPTSRSASLNLEPLISIPPLPLTEVRAPPLDFTNTTPSSNRPRLPLNKNRKSLELESTDKLKTSNKMLPTRNNILQSFDPLLIPPVSHHPPLHSTFYPFAPLPTSIPSHAELRQQLPNLHRISKHCGPPKASTNNNNLPPPHPPPVSHDLIQLLHQYVGMKFNTNALDGSLDYAHLEKAKNSVNTNNPNLVLELEKLHDTLRDQSDALARSIRQLSMYCKDFWLDIPGHGADPLIASAKGKRRRSSKGVTCSGEPLSFVESLKAMALRQGVSSHVLNDVILPPQSVPVPTLPSLSRQWRYGSSVQVKVIMTGWKKSETNSKPLVAIFVNGSAKSITGVKATKNTTKKRKAVKASTKELKSNTMKLQRIQEAKGYDKMNFLDKRMFVSKMLSERAGMFERQMKKQHVHREEISNKREDGRCNVIEKNTKLGIHTTPTLWKVMNQTPYWDEITKQDIAMELSVAWQPVISSRPMFWGKMPVAEVLSEPTIGIAPDKMTTSSHSLYDRLQSLLVEEADGSSGDEESDDDSDILLDPSVERGDNDDFLNVSKLNLDQRTYLQLRALHLIDQPLTPSSAPAVIERTVAKRMFSGDVDSEEEEIDSIEGDLEIAIQRKQLQLSQEQSKNNATVAFLQSEGNALVRHQRLKEDQNALISKHNQLVAKKAQSKKSASGKKESASKEDSASTSN